MKKLILLLLIHSLCFCQNFNQNCIRVSDSLILKNSNKQFVNKNVKVDLDSSYLIFLPKINKNEKFIVLNLSNDIQIKALMVGEEFILEKFILVYNILMDNKKIDNFYFTFNNNGTLIEFNNGDLKSFLKLYVQTINGKYISFKKLTKIAIKNNFKNIFKYQLREDPRWKGPNIYDTKKWKITWTLKQKHFGNDSTLDGYDVIKINATNGKVLCQYHEIEID